MNDISTRFLELYDYLKDAKKVSSKADFAEKLDISSSTITDITKGRSNAGINVVRNIVTAFPEINTDWVLAGVGEMLKIGEKVGYTPQLSHVSSDHIAGESDLTPIAKSRKLSPKQAEKLSPTLSPTEEYCKICEEKDRVIQEQRERILDLKDYIEVLKSQIPGQKKEVG